jgi:polyisoprenoid-binding protein YceI
MLRARSLVSVFVASSVALSVGALAQPTPPAVVEVPAEHAAMGKVYRVHPMKDAQVTFTSDAALEHIKGISNRVAGYCVAPTSGGVEAGLLTGKWVLPVSTIDTGIPLRNEHMRSDRWLHAGEFPEITFEIDSVEGASLAKEDSWFKTYDATLVGKMTIRGTTRDVKIPARLTFMPESDRTRARAPGDLLALRAEYPIKLSDYGVAVGDQAIQSGMVADELTIDTFLLMTTFDPNQRGQGRGQGGEGRGGQGRGGNRPGGE